MAIGEPQPGAGGPPSPDSTAKPNTADIKPDAITALRKRSAQITEGHADAGEHKFFVKAAKRANEYLPLLQAVRDGSIPDTEAARLLANEFIEQQWRADRDSLTGLYNSGKITEIVEQEIITASKINQPVSIAFLDFDHFKEYNTAFGHQATNNVLRGLKSLFSAHTLPWDEVGRFGGDEFVVVLPQTPLASGKENLIKVLSDLPQVVESTLVEAGFENPSAKLLEEIKAAGKEATSGESPFSFSGGLSVNQPGDDASTLLERAERNVKLAKNAGKMQVFDDTNATQFLAKTPPQGKNG